jgi:hypothetical protein
LREALGVSHAALRAARFSRTIAIDDASLRQIVRREFEIDAIPGKNFDAMAAQTPGDMRENRVTVLKLDRKRRAGEDLFDRAEDFERRFFRRLGGGPRRAGAR